LQQAKAAKVPTCTKSTRDSVWLQKNLQFGARSLRAEWEISLCFLLLCFVLFCFSLRTFSTDYLVSALARLLRLRLKGKRLLGKKSEKV